MRAIGVWVACGTWSSHHLTDGAVPRDVVEDEGGKQSDARSLSDAGLWHSNGHDCPRCPQPPNGAYQFHDWLEWQPSRDEVLTKRAEEAQRKADWRARKAAERKAKREAEATTESGSVPQGQTAGHPPDGRRDSGRTDNVSPGDVPRVSRPTRPVPDPYPTRPDPQVPTEPANGVVVRTTADAARDRSDAALAIVGIWETARKSQGQTPGKKMINVVSGNALEALAHHDYDLVARAAREAGLGGYTGLDVSIAKLTAAPPAPRGGQPATTDRKVQAAYDLADELDGVTPGDIRAIAGGRS